MKRFMLFALLTAALAVLATPPETQACGRRRCGGGWYSSYYCPYPVYHYSYAPAYYACPRVIYYSAPTVRQPAGPVVEVAAIDGKGFEPKTLTVAPGTTVRWVNRGKEAHTVTSRSGRFDSGPIPPGGSYTVVFVTPGTYDYFCRPHEKMGMVGSVTVGSSGPGEKADADTHDGTFVSARGEKEFVMADKGKEHSHALSADARVIGSDGKECKLTDLKKGQKIRVTTRKGDLKTATRVEALKAQ